MRLIDADALMKDICGNECGSICDEECEKVMCNYYDYIMDAPAVNRWIPCSEILPERETDVLVYIPVWEDNPIQVAYLMYDGITWELSDGEFNFGKREVLYWMPLPEPPKEGADNGNG